MHCSLARVLLSFAVATAFVSATPLTSRANQANAAVYFITNEPDGNGNNVISAAVNGDGTLTLKRAISTIGLGAHGVTSPDGPDGLFSQGSVKASSSGVLAAVNAGSNTVTAFKIDPNDPTRLTLLGKPTSSGGEFPMSLAFNKDGSRLCALNSGQENGVKCFKVDPKTGLTPLQGTTRSLKLVQTTPPNGPANTASHIIFSEDGKKVLATVKGDPGKKDGFIASWDIGKDDTLSQDFTKVALPKGGLLPFSMTIVPGKNALLATDAAIGFDLFNQGGAGNRQDSANEIKGQGATCWSSFSRQTGNLYLTDIKTSIVTEVNVDNNLKGTIVKQYPVGDKAATIDNDVASVNGKDFLYVLSPGTKAINVFSLNSPGNAKQIQALDLAGPARRAKVALNTNNIQGMTAFVKA